jgi:hypothetical protein
VPCGGCGPGGVVSRTLAAEGVRIAVADIVRLKLQRDRVSRCTRDAYGQLGFSVTRTEAEIMMVDFTVAIAYDARSAATGLARGGDVDRVGAKDIKNALPCRDRKGFSRRCQLDSERSREFRGGRRCESFEMVVRGKELSWSIAHRIHQRGGPAAIDVCRLIE